MIAMNKLAALALLTALAACAEVTPFTRSDGSKFYYVDCQNSMRLFESCAGAARRTCPNGYVQVPIEVDILTRDDRAYDRCIEDSGESATAQSSCARTHHNEGFFACR